MVRGTLAWTYLQGATSATSCGCDKGSRINNATGECLGCGEGLDCPGMGEVYILFGYNSKSDLSVYKCHGDMRPCVGGLAGATCATGRNQDSISCAECQDKYTPGDSGE